MNPEKLRAVGQDIWRFTKKHAKYASFSLLVACAPQPKQEQTQQEPPIPKDAIVLQVTNTPAPEQPTSTPEPTNTPPQPEPTATPKPPEPPPPPFTIETPFPRYGVYAGLMFVDTPSPKNTRGYMAMTTPLDRVVGGVFSYLRDTICSDGSSLRSRGSIKIEPRSFINQGFGQRGQFGEQIEGFMPNPNTVVGRITFPPHPGLKECGEEKVSYGALPKGNGPDDYLKAYIGLFQQAQMRTGLTTAEALAEIERDIGGVKLPPQAPK